MKQTELIMGMPITIETADKVEFGAVEEIFAYLRGVDMRFSPYKQTSELSRLNVGMPREDASEEMQWVLFLCEQTKQETNGYFDIEKDGHIDTSGLVKGWAIQNAANHLRLMGCRNFYVEAGGDVQVDGVNTDGEAWSLGIRNPFDTNTIVKTLRVSDCGVATSGTYIRGSHIYDPVHGHQSPKGIQSLTVVGPTAYDADRFATAAFAMGTNGIGFIENLNGYEGYMIDDNKQATLTTGFHTYVA